MRGYHLCSLETLIRAYIIYIRLPPLIRALMPLLKYLRAPIKPGAYPIRLKNTRLSQGETILGSNCKKVFLNCKYLHNSNTYGKQKESENHVNTNYPASACHSCWY